MSQLKVVNETLGEPAAPLYRALGADCYKLLSFRILQKCNPRAEY